MFSVVIIHGIYFFTDDPVGSDVDCLSHDGGIQTRWLVSDSLLAAGYAL